jgi:xanthine dehydrogenase YagS FAD-binding subunit
MPPAAERSGYLRATTRARAEWPDVEVVARIEVADGTVTRAVVVAGAVAPRPRRLEAVEAALLGPADPARVRDAARAALEGLNPVPQARGRARLLPATVEAVVVDLLRA